MRLGLIGATGCDWVRLVRPVRLVRLGATGCDWVRLGATGCDWVRLGATGCDWVRLGATRLRKACGGQAGFDRQNLPLLDLPRDSFPLFRLGGFEVRKMSKSRRVSATPSHYTIVKWECNKIIQYAWFGPRRCSGCRVSNQTTFRKHASVLKVGKSPLPLRDCLIAFARLFSPQ